MPILINEVIAETNEPAATPADAEPAQLQMPLAPAESELARTLALIRERQQRLAVD